MKYEYEMISIARSKISELGMDLKTYLNEYYGKNGWLLNTLQIENQEGIGDVIHMTFSRQID